MLDQARGQTVRFWMYGGDERVNAYVDDEIRPALERLGVRLQRVPVSDTADAVRRVVAERRAGRTAGGGVDLLWINGENFASGKQAGLWLRDW
ncbi:MAG: ABC transporter substrate-binding protein, partial [Solirubrobacterales bacterium]|nr:ABC transporter substrate-binding protein [Solirubrobacterales bacterium]